MNILILGSGGREHALAWKMAASPLTDKLYCAPGNAGIAQEAECVLLDIGDHAAVIAFCKEKKVDFVVVGPEVPLCAGIVDDLEGAGIKAFGPTKWAARLEGSKGFTKDLCKANDIPTAAYERFKSAGPAKDYVRKTGAPIVVKADGLAAGKGVVVAESVQEAEAAIDMPHSESAAGTATLAGHDLSALGIPSMNDYVDAYVARTGLDPRPHLPVYLAYNFFRIAAILQGIIGRVRDGTATSEFAPGKAEMIRPLADKAWNFALQA